MEGVEEGKLYFLHLDSAKRQREPSLGQSISTNFVADFAIVDYHAKLLVPTSQ